MKSVYIVIFFFLLFPAVTVFSANSTADSSVLQKGIGQFGSGNYEDALHYFREVILDPKLENQHGDAYFWLAKTYISLGKLEDAEKNLEYFLLNYEGHTYFPEALYQKGRLLFLQGEYEKSIQVLSNFIDQYPNNPYVGNSYYWIGESLYSLGHLDKASKIFQTIVDKFPTSFKVEAAKYRISVIDMKYREQELMKFLKWSHEEALKTLEEFQIREKTYEQAISAYQKKLAEYAEAGAARKIDELTLDLREKEAKVVELQNSMKDLQDKIGSQSSQIEELQNQLARSSEEKGGDKAAVPEKTAPMPSDQSVENLKKLLQIKQEALDLKAFYLDWLEQHTES